MKKYTCPMHNEIQEDHQGKCPVCGMNLVLKEPNTTKHMKHTVSNKEMTYLQKFKMTMSMTMGMDHSGLAGRAMAKLMEVDIRNKFLFTLLLTIPIILYSSFGYTIFHVHLPTPIPPSWILLILTTPVFFYGGWLFLYSSYKELQEKKLGMSVLISVGISAAYFFSIYLTFSGNNDSYYEAAAMLITFVLFGHWMEMRSRRGTTDALQALFALVPPQARIIRNGQEVLIPTAEVQLGDTLLLKPGDRIPVDGEIISGQSSIDESLVTGESIPVMKTVGETIIGGSINTTGTLKFKATKVGKDTALAQIVAMVETAQSSKAPGQRLADTFATFLVLIAVGGGIITFIIWFFVLHESVLFALTFAISAVVIACPDALGLATPTAVAVATGLGAKHNILIKDASTLEQLSKIQTIVFDKTGTLTQGKPKVTDFIITKEIKDNKQKQSWELSHATNPKQYILGLVTSLEQNSEHSISQAIVLFGTEQKVALYKVEKFKAISGQGVVGIIDGKNIAIGTKKLMETEQITSSKELDISIDHILREAKTLAYIAIDGKAVALIAVADTVRSSAKILIDKLNILHIESIMITGDNKKTAEAIAMNVGITRVFSEVMPADKAQYIKKLQDEGKFVAMVGDGVNDAPALAQADIGIAIGAGTDVAIETAKVVLMKSDPIDILRAILLSKATVVKMKQNLFWASIYNVLAIPIAAGALYPSFHISLAPEVAALLMSASSIIVAVNAVSLRFADKKLIAI